MIAELSLQGDVAEARYVTLAHRPGPKGGLRGVIADFSKAARRRLVDLMARLDVDRTRTVFMTLTFNHLVGSDEARAALKRFTMRIRRRFPQASALWRKERQQRGAIHYHLLWFRLPFIPQSEVQSTWTACTREALSIVDIRLVRSKKAAMAYVSKYIAKLDTPPGPTSLEDVAYQHVPHSSGEGRFWGVINRDALPIGELFSILVDDDQEMQTFFDQVDRLSRGRGIAGNGRARLYSHLSRVLFATTLGRVRKAGPSVMADLVELIRFKHSLLPGATRSGGVNR